MSLRQGTVNARTRHAIGTLQGLLALLGSALATPTQPGLMSETDKAKLDAIPVTKYFTGTGVTDGSGNATFNITGTGFASLHSVLATIEGGNPCFVRVSAKSATSVTINVQATTTVSLLGVTVIVPAAVSSGITVNLRVDGN